MIDVMSMCQFLLMTSELLSVVTRAGTTMRCKWLRYLITRYEPGDGPQNQMVSFMRSLFEEHVLNYPMLKSTAVSDAGITKQTLYEVPRDQFTRSTYDRAIEALDNVNGEIETLIRTTWGEYDPPNLERRLVMSRKNLLTSLTRPDVCLDPLPPAAAPSGSAGMLAETLLHLGSPRAGALGEIARSVDQAWENAVIDIAPDLIDASFIQDRLETTADELASLTDSIRERGQLIPILVRPHLEHTGRYQIAYGRRRLAAARTLGRPVRATVKQLSDDELVVAQGQENIERKDLSYLERALFAAKLEERGFPRQTIMSAVSTDKASLSKLISVATRIPRDILEAIGPAPKIGRDPWNQLLSALCDNKHALAMVRTIVTSAESSRKTSALRDRAPRCRLKASKGDHQKLSDCRRRISADPGSIRRRSDHSHHRQQVAQ